MQFIGLVPKNGEYTIYVIQKNKANIVAKSLSHLNAEGQQAVIRKYGQSHRLINLLPICDGMREACISPQAPFIEQLKKARDLTIEGKKISKITVMTDEEYQDFVECMVALAQAVAEDKKKNEASAVPSVATPIAPKATKKPMSFSFYKIASKAQNAISESVLNVLRTLEMSNRRNEELAKEKQKKLDDKRHFLERKDLKKDIENQIVLNQSIAAQMLKQEAAAAA